jgi:predicted heme/steroid binding protein
MRRVSCESGRWAGVNSGRSKISGGPRVKALVQAIHEPSTNGTRHHSLSPLDDGYLLVWDDIVRAFRPQTRLRSGGTAQGGSASWPGGNYRDDDNRYLLALMRISSWDMLLHTRFGVLLSIKICLFAITVVLALIAVFVVGPRLKKRTQSIKVVEKQFLRADELAQVDGRGGRPAYIAYEGQIYDVSGSELWEEGVHFGKHLAGFDLSDYLEQAPMGKKRSSRCLVWGSLQAQPKEHRLP